MVINPFRNVVNTFSASLFIEALPFRLNVASPLRFSSGVIHNGIILYLLEDNQLNNQRGKAGGSFSF